MSLSVGNNKEPVALRPEQERVCNILDNLNENNPFYRADSRPSLLIKGALFVIKHKNGNPDWMAQAAHSYREWDDWGQVGTTGVGTTGVRSSFHPFLKIKLG